jgi:hypothetical protein
MRADVDAQRQIPSTERVSIRLWGECSLREPAAETTALAHHEERRERPSSLSLPSPPFLFSLALPALHGGAQPLCCWPWGEWREGAGMWRQPGARDATLRRHRSSPACVSLSALCLFLFAVLLLLCCAGLAVDQRPAKRISLAQQPLILTDTRSTRTTRTRQQRDARTFAAPPRPCRAASLSSRGWPSAGRALLQRPPAADPRASSGASNKRSDWLSALVARHVGRERPPACAACGGAVGLHCRRWEPRRRCCSSSPPRIGQSSSCSDQTK